MKSILLLGPLADMNNKMNTGGIVILFSDLLKQCEKNKITYHVIDTNKNNYPNKITSLISIWLKVLSQIKKYDHVSLHGTANDYIYIAPFVIFFGRLYGLHISLRKFAGNFDVLYDNFSIWKRYLIRYVLKNSDINFFETIYLVDKFRIYNEKTFWFPNVREKLDTNKTDNVFRKRFIFVGYVTKEKGIKELLKVSNLLDESYQIDIYGKAAPDMEQFNFEEYNANFKGNLLNSDVLKKMALYDVLVLPSYREGYPGVVIEALSVGLPIIATNLQGIAEMLNDDISILIDPNDIGQLKNAIEQFNKKDYTLMSKAALKAFEQFDTDIQTKKFFELSMLL